MSLNTEERNVLALLGDNTYDQVREQTGWSRGRIYSLACKAGARKTEGRIRERHEERQKHQMETLAEMINTSCKADVLDFLDGIPDDSIACWITSPPYNLGKPYGNCIAADSMRHVYYHGWLCMVISELARTVKTGGVVALNVGKTRDEHDHLMPISHLIFDDLRRAGLTYQSEVIWEVPHGLTPKQRLAERHETVLIFSKGDQTTFNANAYRVPQKQPDKKAFKGPNRGKLSGHPLGAFPSDVWRIPNVGHNHPDGKLGKHPAQFPVVLAKRLILLYTNAGDLVGDCFSGSGSTCVAAIETGRNHLGADLFYEDLRAKRIAAAKLDTFTPFTGVTDESVSVWQAEARRREHHVAKVPSAAEDLAMCEQLQIFA